MQIWVCLKPVPDNTRGGAMMLNPYDEYALETALKLKEALPGSTITGLSLAPAAQAKEVLKKAVAVGADSVKFIPADDGAGPLADARQTAHKLAAAIKQGGTPDVILFGQQALDTLAGVTGALVAAELGLSYLDHVNGVTAEAGSLKVSRELASGGETWTVPTPIALGVMKCPYELRTANIKGVMAANKAQIDSLDELASQSASTPAVSGELAEHPPKSPGQVVQGDDPAAAASGLIAFLREKQAL